ncbi:hypothetical protein HN588_08800 [Candidatus Bathyarchaeota archaeon]|nr:hypothetical protein [Candidatus Bathyarchaeota archaeon]
MSTTTNTLQRSIKAWIYEAIGKGQSVINGLTKGDAQEVLEVSRKNWIINGDMQVSQRGDYTSASSATNNDYYLDRWKTYLSAITADKQDTGGWLKLTATATDGAMGFTQIIEDVDSFTGKTFTISAKVKSTNTDARILVSDQSTWFASSEGHIGDGNEQRLTVTGTLSSSATSFNVSLRIATSTASATTITDGDYIEFTNVKLEIGDTATPFEVEPYAEVLRKCQRYCWRTANGETYSFIGSGYNASTINSLILMTYPEMRVAPTLTTLGSFQVVAGGSVYSVTGISMSDPTEQICRLNCTVSGATTSDFAVLRNNNDAAAYLLLDAEL